MSTWNSVDKRKDQSELSSLLIFPADQLTWNVTTKMKKGESFGRIWRQLLPIGPGASFARGKKETGPGTAKNWGYVVPFCLSGFLGRFPVGDGCVSFLGGGHLFF
nr:hypothetical protein [Pandoravirus massiliensis]